MIFLVPLGILVLRPRARLGEGIDDAFDRLPIGFGEAADAACQLMCIGGRVDRAAVQQLVHFAFHGLREPLHPFCAELLPAFLQLVDL